MSEGTGQSLSDATNPLLFPRNNNRVSGPESNSCAGCHNQPISGGAGDLSTNVFVLGQRFDFASFDANDWAVGNAPNYFHHGQFTSIREAILNHFGEALQSQQAFSALSPYDQGAVIEFLKTLRMN